MKSIALFSTFVSACAGFVIPITNSTSIVTGYLEPRINQQDFINPDNEPPYTDPRNGAQILKSRILSGVGPAAADSRFFDWDQSCQDAGHRQRIYAAWEYFQELTTRSSSQLAALEAGLPNTPPERSGDPNHANEAAIFDKDPAFTQMFKARDTGLFSVRGSFTAITDNVRNYPGRGNGRVVPALRFICNANNHVQAGSGASLCGSGPEAAQAVTVVPQRDQDSTIEPKYRFHTSSSIVFCPVFFDDEKFPNIDALIGHLDAAEITLKNVDCRERIMLHEYLHLPWVKNMRPKDDTIGYLNLATLAAMYPWNVVRAKPDAYAWYALYSYFNNDHAGCGADIWPPDVTKPVDKTVLGIQ